MSPIYIIKLKFSSIINYHNDKYIHHQWKQRQFRYQCTKVLFLQLAWVLGHHFLLKYDTPLMVLIDQDSFDRQ